MERSQNDDYWRISLLGTHDETVGHISQHDDTVDNAAVVAEFGRGHSFGNGSFGEQVVERDLTELRQRQFTLAEDAFEEPRKLSFVSVTDIAEVRDRTPASPATNAAANRDSLSPSQLID